MTDDAERARVLESVKAAVLATDDRVGDVRRARIGARLAERLETEETAARVARWPVLLRPRLLVAATVMVCVAAGTVALWRSHRSVTVAMRPATPAPVERAAAGEHIEVPAGARVRARLSDRARTTLVGPAVIEVLTSTAELIDVRLLSGTLLADYDGTRGGLLRVRASDLTVEVVGTLFAVEAGARGAAVSVAHGRVRVIRTPDAQPVMVGTAQTLPAGETTPAPITAFMRDELALHQSEGEARVDDQAASRTSTDPRPAPARRPIALAAAAAERPPAPRVLKSSRVVVSPAPLAVSASTTPEAPVAPAAPTPALAEPPPFAPRAPEAAVPVVTASGLYRAAEAAMQRRDRAAARHNLARVAAEFPGDRLAEVARYELAQLSISEGDRAAAARELDTVAAGSRDPALRRSAAFARCRLDLGVGLPAARAAVGMRCLEQFRATYPGAAEDTEVLTLLIAHASQQGQCATVIRLTDEYNRRYPSGSFAAEAARRKLLCQPGGM